MKKKLPLNLIKILLPNNEILRSYISYDNNGEYLIKFFDKESIEDIYFVIVKLDESVEYYSIRYRPYNPESTKEFSGNVNGKELISNFNNWLRLVESYNVTETIFDDSILNEFQNSYYSELRILNEDANYKPFNIKQILMLDGHLNEISEKIDNFKNTKNEQDIDNIKNEINQLKEDLTIKPKNIILKKLSKIWALISKQGVKFIKEFLSEAKRQLIRTSIQIMIEGGKDLL